MKQQTCKFKLEDGTVCGSIFHTAMWHKPKKAIKSKAIKTAADNTNVPTKKKRKKSTPRKLAKSKAWDAFSLYIRTRDCMRFTGDPTQGICVTCKAKKSLKELQAGHFVAGRGNAVLFNEQIVYSQCGYCNQKPPTGLGGNYAAYTLFMFDEGYTREEIEGFLALKGTTKQYKLADFIEIKDIYTQKLEKLLHS